MEDDVTPPNGVECSERSDHTRAGCLVLVVPVVGGLLAWSEAHGRRAEWSSVQDIVQASAPTNVSLEGRVGLCELRHERVHGF